MIYIKIIIKVFQLIIYNNKNRNYEIIYNVNQFLKNNIIEELNKVRECNNIIDKFNNILNIYRKMNIDEIKIIYKVKDDGVQLFSKYFVERNKNNCKLVIDGKEQELKEKYSFGWFSSKKDILEIKLKGITNITNMSYMFCGCNKSLKIPPRFIK